MRSRLDRVAERSGRWVDMAFLFIRFDFTLQIQAPRRISCVSSCKRERFSFTFPVTEDLQGNGTESDVTTESRDIFAALSMTYA